MSTHPLTPLFEPKTIAVVGASQRGEGVGHRVLCNIREGGFAGPVYPIHKSAAELAGLKTYASFASLPERVDLVVVAVPATKVPEVVRDAAQHGAKFALVVSAGFTDTGDEGKRLLEQTLASRGRSGLRLVGPHCTGVMRAGSLNASVTRGIARKGSLAFVSQSGALCSAILDWAHTHNIGFSTMATLGAGTDVGLGEVLDYLALDYSTRAVLLYVEAVDDARRFMSGLRALARIKPVIAVKAGRGGASSGASDDAVFDAALRRAGAVRVATLQQLFSTAELLSHAPRIFGERLAIVSNAGALSALAADRARDLGVPLAQLGESTRGQLTAALPPRTPPDNPVDVGPDAGPERYTRALSAVLADPGVDGALVLLSPQLATDASAVATAVAERERSSSKPVLACFMGGTQVAAAHATFAAAEVPVFTSPEAAVHAFSNLASFRRNQELLVQAPDVYASDELDSEGARLIVESARGRGRSLLSQSEARAVLRAFGIPVNPAMRAANADDALVAAQQLGFPIAMKIDSPDIAHKTEVGGVRLHIAGAAQVRSVYRELTEHVAKRRPEARIDGVIVEPMLQPEGGRELIASVRRDPAFGPVIALGAGGKLASLLGAPAIGLPPLNTRLCKDLLERTNAAPLLAAGANWPAADSGALIKLLLRLSDLVCELPEIRELDINPLLVDARGALVLDARIAVQSVPPSQRRYGHLAIAPYPKHLVQRVQLADGTTITLRPIRPEDTQLEQDFVKNLSLETRRFRFMHALSRLTQEMLIRFTQLDYARELAIMAALPGPEGEQEIGVARYVADGDGRDCEFAIVVADDWQKRGLASHLMRALIAAAREQHFTNMHGDVLADNARMLSWMVRLGFSVAADPEDATLRRVTLPLM